jgi:hypothetical protein
MACIKITLILLLSAGCAQAQTFAEWFSQGKTQKKYLLAQIAALNTYSSYLRKGYNVAKGGLSSISSYVGDELKLHTVYYDRLKNVDPALKANPKVKDILVWQLDINKQTKTWNSEYLASVRSALLKDCDAQLTQLSNVLSSKTELSDAERLQQLEIIHAAMISNLQFTGRFSSQLKALDLQRTIESNDINTLNRLYEKH